MPIRKYKVMLQFPDSVTSPSTVNAYTVEDAAAQVRIARAHEAPFQVIAVRPVEDVKATIEGTDVDKFFDRFKESIEGLAPPMGTQEVERLREVVTTQNRRISDLSEQLSQAQRPSSLEKDSDWATRHLKTLMGVVRGTPSVGVLSAVFSGAMTEVSRLRKLDIHIDALIANEKQLATTIQRMDGELEDLRGALVIERQRDDAIRALVEGSAVESLPAEHPIWNTAYQAVLDLRKKFEAAERVIEVLEEYGRTSAEDALDRTAAPLGHFRKLHPKPGP